MTDLRTTLLEVADAYAGEVKLNGGQSLARVATIVANRGSFFTRLAGGGGCSLHNFERFMLWFSVEQHWPDGLPPQTKASLSKVGFKPLPLNPRGGNAA